MEAIEELTPSKAKAIAFVVPKDPEHDFGTALDNVCNFIKNPETMWNRENIEEKRTVLKLIFLGPVPYHRDSGFGTATFSLPFELCKLAETDKKSMVEMTGIEPIICKHRKIAPKRQTR